MSTVKTLARYRPEFGFVLDGTAKLDRNAVEARLHQHMAVIEGSICGAATKEANRVWLAELEAATAMSWPIRILAPVHEPSPSGDAA